MPTALRGGTLTHWRSWAEGPPEILAIHCALAHSGAWNGLAERLGRPMVAFDLPGHGQSGPWDESIDYQTQSLRMAETFCEGRPMDVIGHSFGATVALRLALERPEAVRRLVLIEPVLMAACRGTEAFDSYMAQMQGFAEAIASGDRQGAARWFTETWGTGADWDQLRAEQQQALAERIHLIPAQDDALFGDVHGLLRPGRLEALKAPVMLVEGAASPPIIAAVGDVLARRIANASRLRIAGAGHMVPITHPAEVAAGVRPFLGTVPGSGD